MISCYEVKDVEPIDAYLRRDVLLNWCLLDAIENNMPPVPRHIWAAKQENGTMVGMMSVEKFPHGMAVALRAELSKAVRGMLRELDAKQTYTMSIPIALRECLLAGLAEVSRPAEHVSLTVSSNDLCTHGSAGEVRKLSRADKPLAECFPAPSSEYQPPLSQFVEWATNDPERQVVYGLVIEGEIVSFVQFNLNIDNIWEVGMIRTRDRDKRKGYAKAVLAHASAELLERGFVPMYDVAATNVASLCTAQAVGYREVCRRFACEGRVRSDQ